MIMKMMKISLRRFTIAGLLLLSLAGAAGAAGVNVEPDPEVHRVVGGLYALSAVAGLQGGKALPTPKQLGAYFTGSLAARTAEAGGAWWVGLPVGQYSTARRFLRAHASELGVTDTPGGQPWLGGEAVWMKVIPNQIQAAPGSGADKKLLFLNGGSDRWWQAPAMKNSTRDAILKKWRAKSAPELHAPKGVAAEKLSGSPVSLPPDMHIGRSSDDIDLSVPMGDVMFNPIPNMGNRQ